MRMILLIVLLFTLLTMALADGHPGHCNAPEIPCGPNLAQCCLP